MGRGRWFIIGQFIFLTMPMALGVSAYRASATGNGFLPFLALLPYAGVALAVQLFRCPSCSERLLSIDRISRTGEYLRPKLWLRCPECHRSFWKDAGAPAEPSKPAS